MIKPKELAEQKYPYKKGEETEITATYRQKKIDGFIDGWYACMQQHNIEMHQSLSGQPPQPVEGVEDNNNEFVLWNDLKEALRVGVNIGMQNVEKPRHEGDFNFNQEKALKECEDYLLSIQSSQPVNNEGVEEAAEKQKMITKEKAYEQATLELLGNDPNGTRQDVIYRAMDIYASQLLTTLK